TVAVRASHRRPRPPRSARPRIAVFSPWPPLRSGVADYGWQLVGELARTYQVDLYHDTGFVPEPGWAEAGFTCADARPFPRLLACRDYHGILYQMGNSRYHRFLYPLLLKYPGVTTLHDFCLAGFHLWHGHWLGRQRDSFRDELLHCHPEQAKQLLATLDAQG